MRYRAEGSRRGGKMMSRAARIWMIAAAALLTGPALAQDVRAGIEAWQAGNHAVVLVDRKVPLTELEEEDVIDPYIEDTNTVAEQDTDVIEVGHVKALSCLWRKKARPEDIRRMQKLYPGASIAHESGGAGTLGAIVKDRRGTLYALTNNHVAAASNQARLLDPVYSPARKDQPDGLPMATARTACPKTPSRSASPARPASRSAGISRLQQLVIYRHRTSRATLLVGIFSWSVMRFVQRQNCSHCPVLP
jgi:hypothetical protein